MRKTKLGIAALVLCAVGILGFVAAQFTDGTVNGICAVSAIIGSVLGVCIAAVYFHALLTEGKEFPKAKTGFVISALVSFAVAAVLWVLLIKNVISGENAGIIALAFAVVSSVLFFVFVIMLIHYAGEIGSDFLSDIRVFVITDILLGLAFSGMALYFALLGSWNILVTIVICVTFLPVVALSLVGALGYYIYENKRNKKR